MSIAVCYYLEGGSPPLESHTVCVQMPMNHEMKELTRTWWDECCWPAGCRVRSVLSSSEARNGVLPSVVSRVDVVGWKELIACPPQYWLLFDKVGDRALVMRRSAKICSYGQQTCRVNTQQLQTLSMIRYYACLIPSHCQLSLRVGSPRPHYPCCSPAFRPLRRGYRTQSAQYLQNATQLDHHLSTPVLTCQATCPSVAVCRAADPLAHSVFFRTSGPTLSVILPIASESRGHIRVSSLWKGGAYRLTPQS